MNATATTTTGLDILRAAVRARSNKADNMARLARESGLANHTIYDFSHGKILCQRRR
jgi:hypothetical protein